MDSIKSRLMSGNAKWEAAGDEIEKLRKKTAEHGQDPYAIVICCSDSRVILEEIFSCGIGELFVIRVAGNVLDNHQLGSIEYAAAHLGCKMILMLGHTGCGAVKAALSGHSDGFISFITEDILEAIGDETDPNVACRMNVIHGVSQIRKEFSHHPELPEVEITGAIYNIATGKVEWLD